MIRLDRLRTMQQKLYRIIWDPYVKMNIQSMISNQKFPSMSYSIPSLHDQEEDVSYDVESLFINIPIEKTINYIIEQIYVHKKLTPVCSKLIFRRLLIKLTTQCTFKFNSRF